MIEHFYGKYAFLANEYECEEFFSYEDNKWLTASAAYNAMKYVGDNKKQIRNIFSKLSVIETTILINSMKHTDIDELSDDVKLQIMESILRAKFSIKSLKHKLIQTNGEQIIYKNDICDNFWGQCECEKCQNEHTQGENHLGKLLEKIRKSISITAALTNDMPEPPIDEVIQNALDEKMEKHKNLFDMYVNEMLEMDDLSI